MLAKHPGSRPSAGKALDHPYLQDAIKQILGAPSTTASPVAVPRSMRAAKVALADLTVSLERASSSDSVGFMLPRTFSSASGGSGGGSPGSHRVRVSLLFFCLPWIAETFSGKFPASFVWVLGVFSQFV